MRVFLIPVLLLISCIPISSQINSGKNRGNKDIVATMKALTEFDGQGRSKNTIYVSKVEGTGDRRYAYAYWVEDRALYILHLPLDLPLKKNSPNYYWLTQKARIDLKSDVVETKKDIAGSSYLVDRKWVKKIIKRCKQGMLLPI